MPLPIPDTGWETMHREEGRDTLQVWQKDDERLLLTIHRSGRRRSPEDYRAWMDGDARAMTQAFESVQLQVDSTNNYPRILWQTQATLKSGRKVFSLLVYIQGKDASYVLHRRWDNQTVAAEERQRWIDYLLSVSACDNRTKEHRRDNLERVGPVGAEPPK